jgi:hypothetical protein
MLLFIFTITIAIAGLAAIEFNQAPQPRKYTVWNDDAERRLLRTQTGRRSWW